MPSNHPSPAQARRRSSRFDHDELRRALELGAVIGLWIGCIGLALYALNFYVGTLGVGIDAHAYWVAGRTAHPYSAAPGFRDAFLYTPVFAMVMRPFSLLPWPAFLTLWMVAESAAFFWLTAPLRWRWRGPLLLVCVPEILLGNLYGFFGLVAVLGLRVPELWALPLLTKITPGGIGLLWFLARGEWRQLARAVLFTLALCVISEVVAPHLWVEWFRFLRHNSGHATSWPEVRLAVSAIVTVLAARTGRRWVVPLAMVFCVPNYQWTNKDFAMLPPAARLAVEGGSSEPHSR
jgi:hypothetical protein